jgi:tRNA-specific 2-thiouridylase
MAHSLGGDALATGHYVQRILGPQGPELHRGQDTSRDQSYFLFTTAPQQLAYLRFPLGHISKIETRDHARRLGLDICEKPDSQDICFVPEGKYAAIVEKMRPGALESGEIVDETGAVLGRHQGIINYTIGQRKGLGLSSPTGEPYYVIALDAMTHRVIIGMKQSLARTCLFLKEVNWLCDINSLPSEITIRFRSSQEPVQATLEPVSDGRALITLVDADHGIAPGQACVFYHNSRVLGGGWIETTS